MADIDLAAMLKVHFLDEIDTERKPSASEAELIAACVAYTTWTNESEARAACEMLEKIATSEEVGSDPPTLKHMVRAVRQLAEQIGYLAGSKTQQQSGGG